MPEVTPSAPSLPPPLRQCGRCRLFFPTATVLHPAELKQWWSCEECSRKIIPSHQPSSPVDANATVEAPK